MLGPWVGMAMVIGTLAALIGGLRLVQVWFSPHPELIRKALHIAMGLVAACFPWLFNETWPVLVLGVLSLAGMLALRTVGALRQTVGNVVSGVGRSSLGEIYFPLAIATLWVLFIHEGGSFERRALLYCVPLLLLALADAAAAIVGSRYGQWRYSTADGLKSTEGSFAFMLCAFVCVHVPLLLGTNTGRLETLLIAVLLAWVAMMFEAIAWGGLDNLALPLVAHLLLGIYLEQPVNQLWMRLAITAGLTVLVLVYRSWTTLQGSALLGAVLVGYIAWALGGWRWVIPPLTLFLVYTWLWPRTPANSERVHNIHAVVSVCAAGLIWLFLYRLLNRPETEYLYLFTLAFAAQLAIIGVARMGQCQPATAATARLTACVFQGWALLFLPYLALEGTWRAVLLMFAALPAVALAAVGFYFIQPQVHNCPTDTPRWLRQGTSAGVASATGLVPLYLL